MMSKEEYDTHIRLGTECGIERTCGKKVKHNSEETATRCCESLNAKPNRDHKLEPYPCAFCGKWHLGRVMVHTED